MTTATEFQAKVTKAGVNMDRLDAIVNGGSTVEVATDGGIVPSIAKVLGDLGDAGEAVSLTAADRVQTGLDRDSALASAALAESAAGPTYTSQALGQAATTTGQHFAVDSGSGIVTIYVRTSGGSTAIRTLATTAALALNTGATLVGAADGAGGSLWTTMAGFVAKMLSSAGSSVIGFIQAGTGAVLRAVQSKLRERVSVRDFGAVGDNVADDTAAVTAAINYCLGLTFTPRLYLGTGFFKVTSLPQITKSLTIEGDNPRSSALMFSGTADAIKVKGSGTRATSVKFCNLTLSGNSMTDGYVVNIEFAQAVSFDNVIFNNPWDTLYARQVGSLTFTDCLMDVARGDVGVDLYGDNTTRNGENDQIDLVVFTNTVIQSNLPAVGGTCSTVMLRVDGRVHTVQMDGLRLLNGGIGLQAKNTPGLAANLMPRFFFGSTLEIENMYAECLDLQACREFKPSSLFAVGSHTADGVKLSSAVSDFSPARCNISSNYLHGLNTNGALSVRLDKPAIYNNSLIGVGQKSGVFLTGSGLVEISGGLAGKDTTLPAYTEPQKSGVDLSAGFGGILIMHGVDLRGNQTDSLYDAGTSAVGGSVSGCPGYNPRGPATQTPGASPYTFVAGLTHETVTIVGTGVSLTIGGVSFPITATGGTFTLSPRQSAVITYATLTGMAVNRA